MGEVIPLFGDRPGAPQIEPAGGERALLVEESVSGGRPEVGEPREAPAFTPIEESSLVALGRKQLSRRELERALAKRGYPEHAIVDELDRLESVGLIDDYALAQHLVARCQERKALAGGAIKAELVRRVIAPGAIDYAMDLIDTGDELARARELAAVRARQYGRLDAAVAERRLSAYLLRRGFSASTVRAAVEEALRSA